MDERHFDRNIDLFGRVKIFTSLSEITEENIIEEIVRVMGIHGLNALQEDYLYWYRRGMQPILCRTKERNSFICNKTVVNFAAQACVFRNGYFLTKPVFYIARNKTDSEKVKELNNYLFTSGKAEADNKVVDWFHTVGVGVLYLEAAKDDNPARPVRVYALDPRSAFVVYSLEAGNRPKYAVNMVMTSATTAAVDVITDTKIFRLKGTYATSPYEHNPQVIDSFDIVSIEENKIGKIPVIEYYASEQRMACFEEALPLCDEYNILESNRADGVEQFIQSLLVLLGVDVEDEVDADYIKKHGMIKLPFVGDHKPEVKILAEQLDQNATQTTLDSLKEQIHALCGMPMTVGARASSFENTGAAYLDRGYALTDTIACNTEDCYRESNMLFTEVFLSILQRIAGFEMPITDLDIQFSKPEINSLLVKSQGAMNLKELGLSPELVLGKSGLSNDPVSDVMASKGYIERAFGEEQKVEVVEDERL